MRKRAAPVRPGLIVMAKRPERGQVKTRIAAALGNDVALAVYARLLAHTRDTAHGFARATVGAYGWWVAGSGSVEWARGFDPDADVVATQQGDDLGARMHNAFAAGFAYGWHPVVMIGCDAPSLCADDVVALAAAAVDQDVAIIPAHDGGYVAIALNRPTPQLFTEPRWGGNDVLATTQKIITREHLTCRLFAAQPDLDTVQDLCGFPVFDPRTHAD